ncbi:excalibur calcium-binding domain-containing protein [Cryptosporangium sp. NPDC048952]|uniref:excalibur calcium-binding domain-containing protein n=1 Tax=Cryptosporangium sp. NPDC048952 TaxID=3363961 RepID=UPI00371F99D1
MSYAPPQHPVRRRSDAPYWVLIALGGVLVLFCGLCGVTSVFFADTDPVPTAGVEAAPASPSAPQSPSATPPPSASAPLVGDDEVLGGRADVDVSVEATAEASAEVDVSADVDAGRRAVPEAAPTTRAAAPRRTTQAPAPARTTARAEAPADDSGAGVYYKNCDAVRAAGAAPIHVGDLGYAKHLDRDGDGIGCE